MKKILFALVALVCSMSVNAQLVKVMKEGQVVASYASDAYDQVVFEEEETEAPSPFDLNYYSVFTYSGSSYYWSKSCSFSEVEPWTDDYGLKFNGSLNSDFSNGVVEQQGKGREVIKFFTVPAYWDAETNTVRLGTYYSFAYLKATEADAEKWGSNGVSVGSELYIMVYNGNNGSADYVDFEFAKLESGSYTLKEKTAGSFQIVLGNENAMLAYFPAKVAATNFVEKAASNEAKGVKPSINLDLSEFVPFETPIKLDRPVKRMAR